MRVRQLMVRDAITECVRKGLTGIHEMGADLYSLASYRRLVERGQFPFRNYAAVRGKEAWGHYRERGPEAFERGAAAMDRARIPEQ